ncbi:MAG TPA: hypothetical protein VL576_02710 [Candidatus Paceibacterota bacterium]|nr:hypothetical protein [Candidatus Paceibacterota bacterium]
MEKRSYIQLLADLFEYLLVEWGYVKELEFQDDGDTYKRHEDGYKCYQLNPKSFGNLPHTIGLKKINDPMSGWAGPEGLSLAYWTNTPLHCSEPCLIISAEKRPEEEGGMIRYWLKIKVLQSYDPKGGFALNWAGSEQVMSIVDRARALLKLEEYVDIIEQGSIDDIIDATVQDYFPKPS